MAAIYKHTAILLISAMGFSSASEARAATYDVALKDAMAKADVRICDTIDKPFFQQDYGISVEQAQDMCRVEVIAAQGKPEACMALDNKRQHPADETVRHRCLERMAKLLKRANICAMIPPEEESTQETMQRARCKALALFSARNCRQFDSDQQAQMRLFRDNCRIQTITDPGQCTQGFYASEISKRLNNQDACISTVAANTRNAALCVKSTSQEKRGACETNVRQWQENDKATNDPDAGDCKKGCP